MSTETKSPKEITFSEMREIIRQELINLEVHGLLVLLIDEEGTQQAHFIATEIENALKEDIYG